MYVLCILTDFLTAVSGIVFQDDFHRLWKQTNVICSVGNYLYNYAEKEVD